MTENISISKESEKFQTNEMKKEQIVEMLKSRHCRITRQRLMLLDIILEEECACCKEIYYKALKKDKSIGTAPVYRMINTLESIGAINRKNMYKISCEQACEKDNVCTVRLDDNTEYHLSAKMWNQVITQGLKKCGYIGSQNLKSVVVRQCEC